MKDKKVGPKEAQMQALRAKRMQKAKEKKPEKSGKTAKPS